MFFISARRGEQCQVKSFVILQKTQLSIMMNYRDGDDEAIAKL